MNATAVITIGIDPEIHVGPVTLAWHGLTIAIGIMVGGWFAARWLREQGLDIEPLYTLGGLLALGGIIGGRLFYVVERDPADLLSRELFSTRGFTFDGGVILAGAFIAFYAVRARLGRAYLDAVAVALPVGVAVGRTGDVINGEHYGAQSDFFLAVRNSHPDALTPDSALAYHSGGLYEVLLGALIFAVVWPLRHRVPRPGDLVWLVIGLFSAGRFLVFFARNDSPDLTLGLDNAQWTSLAMFCGALVGWALSRHRARGASPVDPVMRS